MRGLRFLSRPIVIVLFLCSGASGLIFETLWMRMLTTTFGATTFAISTLLTVYMGGLALGGWLAGAIADRLESEGKALIVYGGLELVVGAYGLLFPVLLGLVQELHGWIWAQWTPGPYAFALVRFLIVSVVLLLPTTAMGATLPVLSRYYARREAGLGRDVGTLYSINILGAVAGTFLAGFVLMPSVGLSATNKTACSINLLLCVVAVSLGEVLRRRHAGAPVPAVAAESEAPAKDEAPSEDARAGQGAAVADVSSPRVVTVALVAVAVSGLVAMVYQQAWTRVLALIVGSSVYAFALILMAFLLGLAAGGGVYSRRTAHRPGQVANLGVIHLLIAAMALIGTLYMDRLPLIFIALARSTHITPQNVFLLKFLICSLVVLLPTFFMGMIFPATIAVCAGTREGVARTVGRVYSINTLGAILGSFLGGFVLIPLLGTQYTLVAMIVANLLLAVVYTGVSTQPRRGRVVNVGVAGGILMIALLGAGSRWDPTRMTAGVFRLTVFDQKATETHCPDDASPLQQFFRHGAGRAYVDRAYGIIGFRPDLETQCDLVVGRRLVHFREGLVATVSTWHTIVEGFEPKTCWEYLSLQVNGKSDASSSCAFRLPPGKRCADYLGHPKEVRPAVVSVRGDMETQVLSGLLGAVLYPGTKPPRRALVIGWGSGISVGEIARVGLAEVDAVELEPQVLRGARFFERYNRHAREAKNVRVLEADGRNVLVAMKRGFDLIVSEPSNPWMTGASSLFTQQFFRLVRKRLRRGGLFIQWLQLYEISKENVLSIIATLRSVFPYVTVFRPQNAEVDLLLVSSFQPIQLDGPKLLERMRAPAMKAALRRIRIQTLGDLVVRQLVPARTVDRLVRGVPVNTDDNARIEFSAPRDLINYRKHSPERILAHLHPDPATLLQRIHRAPAGLGLQIVDAFLRLGEVKSAKRVLDVLPPSSQADRRRRVLQWLTQPPDLTRLRKVALAEHPEGARWQALLDKDPEGGRRQILREIGGRPVPAGASAAPDFELLGLLLADTLNKRLSLLFLTAAQALRKAPRPEIERVRVFLLRHFHLHDLALRRALSQL